MENSKKSKGNEIFGGIFFFAGLFSLIGVLFNADGASLGASVLGIAIGLPLFWPRLKIWLNMIKFDSK
jgi:dolichol kinase